MGYTTSAYHFYGVHVPDDQWTEGYAEAEGGRLDDVIKSLGFGSKSAKVSHLTAGRYDQHMLFLLIDIDGLDVEVELGSYRMSMPPEAVPSDWNLALSVVASEAGYSGLLAPRWITVPSID